MRASRRKLLLLAILLATFPLAVPNTVQAGSDPGYYITRPTTHASSGLAVSSPASAYDNNLATYADFPLNVIGYFTVKGFPAGGFSSTDVIAMVDISMDYDIEAGGMADWKIYLTVSPSTTEMILEPYSRNAYSGTEVWKDVNDPIDLDWSWTDISNLAVTVYCGNVDPKGKAKTFSEYEVWVTVYYFNEPTLYVDPTSTQKNAGESFSIDINITGFAAGNWSGGVYGWEFKLYYNGTLLNGTVGGATEGTYLSSAGTTSYYVVNFSDTEQGGLAWLSCTLQGHTAGKTGDGILATISFYVKANGQCNLTLNSTKLSGYDYPNKRIYAITHNAVSGDWQTAAASEFLYGAALEIAVAAVLVALWWRRKRTRSTPKLYPSPVGLS